MKQQCDKPTLCAPCGPTPESCGSSASSSRCHSLSTPAGKSLLVRKRTFVPLPPPSTSRTSHPISCTFTPSGYHRLRTQNLSTTSTRHEGIPTSGEQDRPRLRVSDALSFPCPLFSSLIALFGLSPANSTRQRSLLKCRPLLSVVVPLA